MAVGDGGDVGQWCQVSWMVGGWEKEVVDC